VLPSYLIIGAGKCGTSSLNQYLRRHPDVSGPRRKEINFFARERTAAETEEYVTSLGEGLARGEASPRYTMWPRWPGVPERIRSMTPDVRLIYIVGDPLRKFTGSYREGISIGAETRSFGEALAAVDDPAADRYLVGCRFGQQLAQYRTHFPAEQILVIDQDDLRHHREATMQQVYRHVGVDPALGPESFEFEANTAADQRDWSQTGRAIRRLRAVPMLRRLPAHYRRPIVLGARAVLSKPIPAVALSPRQFEFLADRLREDMALLRSLTRADLGSQWQL
jgi:hypothetical protein